MKHRTTIVLTALSLALSACWSDGTIIRACAKACSDSGQVVRSVTSESCDCEPAPAKVPQ